MTRIDEKTGRFLPSEKREFSQELLKDLFEYRDGFLYRKTSPAHNAPVGSKAGSLGTNGYWYVSVQHKKFLLHRLIWLYHHGYLPKYLDHKDGNPLNNDIKNLRECNLSQNLANAKCKTKSGLPKGVIRNGKNFGARLKVNGKKHWLGTYHTVELAKECYDCAAELAYGEFARSV